MLSKSEQIQQQFSELSRAIAAASVVADVANKLEEDSDSGELCDHCKELIDSKPDWYDVSCRKSLTLALDVLSSHTDAVYSRLETLQIEQKEGEQNGATDKPAWTQFDFKDIENLSNNPDALLFAQRFESLRAEDAEVAEVVDRVLDAVLKRNKEGEQ